MLKKAVAVQGSTQLISTTVDVAAPSRSAEGTSVYKFPLSDDAVRIAIRLTASPHNERRIGFTGTANRDGVTTIAAQVALALVQLQPGPVLLIDANLRKPSLHELFGITREPGLFEVLTGVASLARTARPVGHRNLRVVPSGNDCPDLVGLFSSPAFSASLDSLIGEVGFVLLDMPPVIDCPEASIIASKCDGAIIVMAAGRRTRHQLMRVKQDLESVRAPVLGAVLSHVKHSWK
jgi:capsular exopolysaccharide synthesis family protein